MDVSRRSTSRREPSSKAESMTAHTKPRVCHYLSQFPTLTETFIPPLLFEARATEPEIRAGTVAGNGHFPFSVQSIGAGSTSRFGNLAERLSARLAGFESREEHRLWSSLRTGQPPDLLHAHFGPQGSAATRPCQRLGIPLVVTFYGHDLALTDPLNQRRYEKLWSASSAFFAEGPAMRDRLVAMGAPKGNVHLQPLPIQLEGITYEPRSRGIDEEVRVLQVARLVAKKGVAQSIRAIDRLRSEGEQIALTIVGDGPLRAQLEAMVKKAHLDEVVQMIGAQDHARVRDELRRAHLLLQPSETAPNGDTEGGAPYILLEAQAAGLCVVATNHADIPNTVAPEALFMAREGDLDDLVAKLTEAVRSSNEWPRRGESGRRFVEQNHDAKLLVARTEEIYAGVIAEMTRPTPSASRS